MTAFSTKAGTLAICLRMVFSSLCGAVECGGWDLEAGHPFVTALSARPSNVSSSFALGTAVCAYPNTAFNDWVKIGRFTRRVVVLDAATIRWLSRSMRYGLPAAVTSSSHSRRLKFFISKFSKVKLIEEKSERGAEMEPTELGWMETIAGEKSMSTDQLIGQLVRRRRSRTCGTQNNWMEQRFT